MGLSFFSREKERKKWFYGLILFLYGTTSCLCTSRGVSQRVIGDVLAVFITVDFFIIFIWALYCPYGSELLIAFHTC